MSTNSSASDLSLHSITRVISPLEKGLGNARTGPRPESRGPAEVGHTWRRWLILAGAVLVAAMASMAGWAGLSRNVAATRSDLVFYTVQPRDLPIQVVERGTLESQKDVQVICEVDDIQGDGILGTPILWIVDNGATVEEGDLLVELDAASHLERLDDQVLDTEEARVNYTQANIYYLNRLTRNETLKANAELNLEIANLELKQYEDEQGGTYQIELQEVELNIEQRLARKEIDEANLIGTEQLHALGYKGRGDLAQAKLQAMQASSALNRETSRQRRLTQYSYTRNRRSLEGALESAQRRLIQVERDNAANVAQAKARLDAAKLSLEREEERLTRYREQLERCKIYAPQSGMVAYHVESSRWGSDATIEEGAAVRDRQPILSIPSLSHMQVKTSVHESVVDRVKAGMRATVSVDAFPDRRYEATVDSVAVLPDPGGWLSSDTKVYRTVVKIDEEVTKLKPGMTAVAEIHVDHLKDVLAVPVQAIVERGEETWCYCLRDGRISRCLVEIGKTNDKFVEICAGLEQGDQVVLNPSALLAEDAHEVAADKVPQETEIAESAS